MLKPIFGNVFLERCCKINKKCTYKRRYALYFKEYLEIFTSIRKKRENLSLFRAVFEEQP